MASVFKVEAVNGGTDYIDVDDAGLITATTLTISGVMTSASVSASGNIASTGGSLIGDIVAEATPASGVTVDGVLMKDSLVGGTARPADIIRRAYKEISAASVATLNATPVELIAAPGAGKVIQVESIRWWLDHAGVDYDAAASGDTLVARYTNASGAVVVDAVAGDTIGAASADYHVTVHASPEVIHVANAAVVAHITTGEWYSAAGDGVLKAEILYRVVDLEFAA